MFSSSAKQKVNPSSDSKLNFIAALAMLKKITWSCHMHQAGVKLNSVSRAPSSMSWMQISPDSARFRNKFFRGVTSGCECIKSISTNLHNNSASTGLARIAEIRHRRLGPQSLCTNAAFWRDTFEAAPRWWRGLGRGRNLSRCDRR